MINYCGKIDCKNKILKMIGYCKGCEQWYCYKHRYMDSHDCIKLEERQINEKDNLSKKLMKNAFIKEKVIKI